MAATGGETGEHQPNAYLWAVKGHSHQKKRVGESLAANADGTVPQVGLLGRLDRVVVDVDDAVEVAGHGPGHLGQLLKVKEPALRVEGPGELLALPSGLAVLLADEARQRDRGQVADGSLVGRRVLDDLSAQVGALDGAEVLGVYEGEQRP